MIGKILIAVVLYLILIGVLYFFARNLAVKHGHDVRVVSYVFALSATVTYVVACAAGAYGAIDVHGNSVGSVGTALLGSFRAMLDLPTEIEIYFAIAAIVLLPQFISYILSGLSGCAKAPLFVGVTMKVLLWLCVKSFATVSGVLLAVSVYGWFHHWNGLGDAQFITIAYFSVALLAIPLAYLFIYRDIDTLKRYAEKVNVVRCVGEWFNRAVRG